MSIQKVAYSAPAPAVSTPPLNTAAVSSVASEFFEDVQQIESEAFLAGSPGSLPSTPKTSEPKSKFFATPEKMDIDDEEDWFESFFDASSTPATPEKKRDNATEFATPSPLKTVREILQQEDVRFDLMRSQTAALDRGLNRILPGIPSPKHSELVEEFQEALIANFNTHAGRLAPIPSPTVRKKLFAPAPGAEKPAPWAVKTKDALDIVFIHKSHLTEFDGRGKHICPPGDPLDTKIFERKTHRETGVWCGFIPHKEKSKYSTFIPRQMTEEAFLSLVSAATSDETRLIAKEPAKALYFVPNHSWVIEVLYDKHDIASAYPIFHFEEYKGQEVLKIELACQEKLGEPVETLIFEQPYAKLIELVRNSDIEYDTAQFVIIDIGMLLGAECPIPRGILVAFPKNYYKRIL